MVTLSYLEDNLLSRMSCSMKAPLSKSSRTMRAVVQKLDFVEICVQCVSSFHTVGWGLLGESKSHGWQEHSGGGEELHFDWGLGGDFWVVV